MIKNKLKLMKTGWLILLCIGIILTIPSHSQALLLTNPDVDWYVPVYLTIDEDFGRYYTDYKLYALEFNTIYGDPDGELEAFCVEDVGINSGLGYELVPVPSSLYDAALLAGQFYYNPSFTYSKTATQIAIWEIVFDSETEINLSQGNLRIGSGNSYYDEVDAILDAFIDGDFIDIGGPVGLAQSPPGSSDPEPSQNYLVPASVPDAGIMWLLGPAFIALGVFSRKKLRK